MQLPKIKRGTLLEDGKQKWAVVSVNQKSVTLRKQKGESKVEKSFSEVESMVICDG
jgi:NMD protein affecting ribosome stability and mRNA decay